MIRKQIGLFLITAAVLLNGTVAFCGDTAKNDGDSCKCAGEIDNLNLRIDSLEARLEGLNIQMVESDPFKSGKYLQWGKGLTVAIAKSEPSISLDMGYTFTTPKSFRMGIAAGFDGELGAECDLPDYGFYGKLTYGTSVFVNFISFNGYVRALFYPEDALRDGEHTTGAVGGGAELEFWLSPACCYTFGGSMTVMRHRDDFSRVKLGEVNFIGFKYFPQCKRKKR